jgi:hypothetical protein
LTEPKETGRVTIGDLRARFHVIESGNFRPMGLERSRARALRLRSVEDLSLDNPEIVFYCIVSAWRNPLAAPLKWLRSESIAHVLGKSIAKSLKVSLNPVLLFYR